MKTIKLLQQFIKLSSILCVLLVMPAKAQAQQGFITTWNTNGTSTGGSTATQIRIPTTGTGYNYNVSWVKIDTPSINGTLLNQTGSALIDNLTPGIYRVEITGTFPRIYFNSATEKLKILTIEQWGNIAWSNMQSSFWGCTNLIYNATDSPNLSGVTNMSRMFSGCTSLVGNSSMNNWLTATVIDMSELFKGAPLFNSNISNWNTATVTNMDQIFSNATLFNQNIGSWNTANVTSMFDMFREASSFNQNIGNWNTANVVNMNQMFTLATSFNQDIGNWNTVKVTDMGGLFGGASAFNQNIGNWNTTNVTWMANMFFGASSFNQNIGNWNTANVTNMSQMFTNATAFNQNIASWNIANVTNMGGMFSNASSFNQNLASWTFNANVVLNSMLNNAGMDCNNYSATLQGWAANAVTPNGRSLGANSRIYNVNAIGNRNILITSKGWTITGDSLANISTTPSTNVNPNCGATNGRINFTAVGVPNGNYTFNYTKNAMAASVIVSVNNNAMAITGLSAGIYTDFELQYACATSNTTVVTLSVLNPTIAAGTVTNPTTCQGTNGSIVFTTANIPNGTYSLSYTGAGSPKNVTVSNNAFSLTGIGAGSYADFSLTSGCAATAAASKILSDPALPTLTLGTPSQICSGASSFTILYTATTGSPTSYSISGPGIITVANATLPASPITINLTGALAAANYTYAMTVRNAVGCTSNNISTTLAVSATSDNITNITSCDTYTWANNGQIYTTSGIKTGTTTNCVTQKLNLIITPSSDNITNVTACNTYTWANNGQTYTTSGIKTGITANCVTQKLNLTINAKPIITGNTVQNFSATATLANIVVNPTNVVWYASLANALAGSQPLMNSVVLTNGSKYYAVTIANNCPSTPFEVTVGTTLATDNFAQNSHLLIYPNPTKGIINIETKEALYVSVYNMLGRKVLESKIDETSNLVNLTNLSSGTYLINTRNELGQNRSTKVVIE